MTAARVLSSVRTEERTRTAIAGGTADNDAHAGSGEPLPAQRLLTPQLSAQCLPGNACHCTAPSWFFLLVFPLPPAQYTHQILHRTLHCTHPPTLAPTLHRSPFSLPRWGWSLQVFFLILAITAWRLQIVRIYKVGGRLGGRAPELRVSRLLHEEGGWWVEWGL